MLDENNYDIPEKFQDDLEYYQRKIRGMEDEFRVLKDQVRTETDGVQQVTVCVWLVYSDTTWLTLHLQHDQETEQKIQQIKRCAGYQRYILVF